MKQICRYLKLKKLKSGVAADSWKELEGTEFIVIFDDGSTFHCIGRDELYNCLEKDHIKSIRYIFDMTDRIVVRRDIIIDIKEV